MNEDLSDIQYSSIRQPNYKLLFEQVEYNGKNLSEKERRELVANIDDTISLNYSGLPLIQNALESSRGKQDEFNTIYHTVASVLLFTTLTMTDCLTANKYFLVADTDYDRRFMRGKMMVILNEGFKRLYGFDEKKRKDSEWNRLKPWMERFPAEIRSQYSELTTRLDQHAKTSSWWREERNIETHLDAEKLYQSRQKEVIESKVVMDNLKLFDTLLAVNEFLGGVHACLRDHLEEKYLQGELQ